MESGIDGTSVYLISVSFLPNCGLDRETRLEGEDDALIFVFSTFFSIFLNYAVLQIYIDVLAPFRGQKIELTTRAGNVNIS
jgi:hypothetical protein